MESLWTFFIGGKFYNISRDEGETRIKFDVRVNFILNALSKMHILELVKFSKMYSNMVMLGIQPTTNQKDKIKWLLGIEERPIEDSYEEDEVAFDDSKLALQMETIISADVNQIVMASGATITPLGETSFIEIPGNKMQELSGQVVNEVILSRSSDDGKTQGVVLEVLVENDGDAEIIELKTCADPACDEPAPVLVTNPELNIGVIVNPILIEIVDTPSENDEVFGDTSARNAFLIPDMKCYNFNAGDDPEETMETCVMERFSKQPDLAMKLRSTKERNLIFKPSVDDPNLHYWSEENRYGRILMKVRGMLKPIKNTDSGASLDNLRNVVIRFFEIPIDDETMTAYRKQILTTVDMLDGKVTDFSPSILMNIFKVYDMEMFESNFEHLMNNGNLKIIFKWTEEDVPCGLDVQDDGIFTLEPSKKVFENLPQDDSKHNIFGVVCTSAADCLLVFVESFIATILYETLKLDDTLESVSENIFGHISTDLKFAVTKPKVETATVSVRDRLLKLQVADPQADIIITINGLGRVIVISARSSDTVLVKAIPGNGNVEVTSEQRSQSYTNVTHIQDVIV